MENTVKTVWSVHALEALPAGAIFRDDAGQVCEVHVHGGDTGVKWVERTGSGQVHQLSGIHLPVTVLWVPRMVS